MIPHAPTGNVLASAGLFGISKLCLSSGRHGVGDSSAWWTVNRAGALRCEGCMNMLFAFDKTPANDDKGTGR